MAHPHATALGNDVILAARALARAHIPNTSTFRYTETIGLLAAVELYEHEVCRPQPPSPRHPDCQHPRLAWAFSPEGVQCGDCHDWINITNTAPL